MSAIESIQGLSGQLTQLLQNNNINNIQDEKQVSGFARGLFDVAQSGSALGTSFTQSLLDASKSAKIDASGLPQVAPSNFVINRSANTPSVGDVVEGFINSVNEKGQASKIEATKIFTGESDNLHQAIIAGQEANVAFTLMVEVRNQLVDSFKELMRMQV